MSELIMILGVCAVLYALSRGVGTINQGWPKGAWLGARGGTNPKWRDRA